MYYLLCQLIKNDKEYIQKVPYMDLNAGSLIWPKGPYMNLKVHIWTFGFDAISLKLQRVRCHHFRDVQLTTRAHCAGGVC